MLMLLRVLLLLAAHGRGGGQDEAVAVRVHQVGGMGVRVGVVTLRGAGCAAYAAAAAAAGWRLVQEHVTNAPAYAHGHAHCRVIAAAVRCRRGGGAERWAWSAYVMRLHASEDSSIRLMFARLLLLLILLQLCCTEKKQGKYGSDGLSINQKLGMQILYNILIYNPLLFVFQEYSFYLEKQFLLKIFPVPGTKRGMGK